MGPSSTWIWILLWIETFLNFQNITLYNHYLLMMSQKEAPMREAPIRLAPMSEAPMSASWVLPRKVAKIVWISVQSSFEDYDGCFLLCTSSSRRKHPGSTQHHLIIYLMYMPELVGFQTMVILDHYGMTFDAVGVFSLVFQLLFKSGSSYCG